MTSPISYLPVWKANATPAERLRELAYMAEKHPGDFAKFVIAYTETLPDERTKTRCHCYGLNTIEAIGTMEIAKFVLHEKTSE